MRRDNLAELEAIEKRLSEAACHIDGEGLVAMDELFDAVGALSNYIDARQREARTEYAVQQIDQQVQVKGEAIKAKVLAEQATLTPRERQERVDRDLDALFGPAHE